MPNILTELYSNDNTQYWYCIFLNIFLCQIFNFHQTIFLVDGDKETSVQGIVYWSARDVVAMQ